MPDTIWDAVMLAVGDRLAAVIPDVPLDRDRRAPVAEDQRPRMVIVLGETPAPDYSIAATEAFHTIEILVAGHVQAATDSATRIAINTLRARVIVALSGYRAPPILDVIEGAGETDLIADEDSARAAGSFQQSFVVTAVSPAGSPYAP